MSNFSQQEWLTQVSKGEIPNHERIVIRGINNDVGTSFETIWPESGVKVFQSAAAIQTLSSDSANDTLLGTGARVITVKGLLSDYSEAEEDVEMDGLTEVSTVNSFLRINAVFIKTGQAGSLQFNDGIIYIGTGVVTSGKPAVVNNLIIANVGISESGFYTVPLGKKLLSYDRQYGIDTGKSAIFVVSIIEEGTKRSVHSVPIFQNFSSINDQVPLLVEEKIDIIFSAVSTSGGGSSSDISIRAVAVLYIPNA